MLSAARGRLGAALRSSNVLPRFQRFVPARNLSRNAPLLSQTLSESFLSGSSSNYIDEMYVQWKHDPNSVHKSWDAYFRTGSFQAPPSLVADYSSQGPRSTSSVNVSSLPAPVAVTGDAKLIHDTINLVQMVRAYQVRGHYISKLDPLEISTDGVAFGQLSSPQEFELSKWGFTEADLDREFDISQQGLEGFMGPGRGKMTLRQIVRRLRETYCHHIGLEYMHIPSRQLCNWIRARFETPEEPVHSKEEKLRILERLTWSDHFERFCATKYTTHKRFGLEGCESLIPGMKAMVDIGADLGVHNIVVGMPHRGRLNVLTTVINKPLQQIFYEFSGIGQSEEVDRSGDVKYHLGYSSTQSVGKEGKSDVHISLVANPSHLECVNPVVCGKTRAKQFYDEDTDRSRNVPILLHGDAAFSGQGVVYETMTLSDLPAYTSGGTIHIVVNNQIGFTTDPKFSRSSSYCSDVAKAFNAPIFHVNADDPEAVVRVCEAAMEWRQTFKRDVVIDLIGYRKHGHNETDEPAFTQPHMYSVIKNKKSILDIYSERLIREGSLTEAEIKDVSDNVKSVLNEAFEASKHFHPADDWLNNRWAGLTGSRVVSAIKSTGVAVDKLKAVGTHITTIPAEFTPHRGLKRVYDERSNHIKSGGPLDWATAESLAFATLVDEGIHVRLSGQDVERGTFSQRHAVLHDQKEVGHTWTPISTLPNGRLFSVSNSNLSEFGVLGFEYGYSLENPSSLVLWEAQFGDFVNGAQIIIDQFISSGEAKWLRQSGLVLLLPHGYEGAGPEHSSCRFERFLQNSADHPDIIPDMSPENRRQIQQTNWQVVNCSTPANYFHVLRRQIHRNFRKPLIVVTPKSLLRHRECVSSLDDMAAGTRFQRFIHEDSKNVDAKKVRRLLLCTGKVYYDLHKYRTEHQIKDVAIGRVEQISPFPFDHVAAEQARFPNAEVVWVQEEPINMGAWFYVSPRIETSLRDSSKRRPRVIGRKPAASPATGWASTHNKEQAELVKESFA
eukprot:TRINITY_DN57_c0_g1_i3.p1 TRINITY_DN57_c0_g1~~TRINITY_DN57_c0_g1_i3.p1  ORF type:complete len:1008 (-),score=381.79 TRINITY_DN57_c0_g1_i3:135-3158(-)